MPKSLEELFDGPAADPTQLEQPQQETTSQEPNKAAAEAPAAADKPADKPQDRPAPEAQKDQPPPEKAAAGPDASQEKGAPPAPEDNDGRDPAYGRLRKERNDYREQLSAEKVERARAEERFAAAERERKAFEAELQRLRALATQQPVQQSQPVQFPNPAQDPAGYHAANQQIINERLWQERCTFSEVALKSHVPAAEVDAAISNFTQEMGRLPLIQHNALGTELRAQTDPARWVYERQRKQQALAEIGEDPASYRERIIAEERAKWEADMAAQRAQAEAQTNPETQSAPRQPLPPSLGKVPNAGDRSGPAHTGPTPIEALWGT